jgi:L-alanine-DL-glutamate epimerase-like enolase superfamily enzyme
VDLSFETLDLTLHVPFTISRGTQLTANNVKVCLTENGSTGLGEAAPSRHYGELQDSVLAFLERLRRELDGETAALPIATLHDVMDRTVRLNPAAKAAVDMATYDLLGKRLGAPVYQILGLDPGCTPRTSYTIGIDTPEVMGQKAADARQYPILKVKVGTPRDEENLQAIREQRPDAVIRVDANAAWTAKEAIRRIERLSIYDLEFVEQPVKGSDLAGLDAVRRAVSLPIIADESCVVPQDVPRVAPFVDGINIKLMKCGGIYPAMQMIHLARAHHLSVMMGCMIESSIAITAAAHLSPLIDYADLDGNLLIDDDPYTGVQVEAGKLVLPDAPGLGLQPAR